MSFSLHAKLPFFLLLEWAMVLPTYDCAPAVPWPLHHSAVAFRSHLLCHFLPDIPDWDGCSTLPWPRLSSCGKVFTPRAVGTSVHPLSISSSKLEVPWGQILHPNVFISLPVPTGCLMQSRRSGNKYLSSGGNNSESVCSWIFLVQEES